MTSAEMEFIRRTAKYAWQDYKTSDKILSELKIRPVLKKFQNYRNKWVQHFRRMDGDRQTATLNCDVSTMWETNPRRTPQKRLLDSMGLEQSTRAKTLQAIG